jgi:hypothetical protein
VPVGEGVLDGEGVLEEEDAGKHEVSLPVAMKNGEVRWPLKSGKEP